MKKPVTTIMSVLMMLLLIPALSLITGCATTDGGAGGWVVVGDSSGTAAPESRTPPGKAEGWDVAARNHMRTAYRFLQKDKPDHALRELEKARAKMSQDYWFHYYLGGAYYMKALYGDASRSWELAYTCTKDPHLRSRILTCRSFAEYRVNGEGSSVELLSRAVDLDNSNQPAIGFLSDLRAADKNDQTDQGAPKSKKTKPDKNKAVHEKGKQLNKGKKIEDKDQFKAYFLVEMPEK